MPLFRHTFLAAQGGGATGALVLPGRLLAALEAATQPTPKLDDWGQVRAQFRLAPEYLHFAGVYFASYPAQVRDAIESGRRGQRPHQGRACRDPRRPASHPARSGAVGGRLRFGVDGKKPRKVVKALFAKKVIASTSPYANSCARLSAGIFNTEAEIDQALGAVRSSIA